MNSGERNELLIKIKFITLRDNGLKINNIGKINKVGFIDEYKELNSQLNIKTIQLLSNEKLKELCIKLNIDKSSPRMKADVIINEIPISLKSHNEAPPALVNQTP